MLLVYVAAGLPDVLVYRQQRDRYQTAYPLRELPANFIRLGRVGMAQSTRLQIELVLRA